MSDAFIFLYGLFVTGLCVIFAVVSVREMRKSGEQAERRAERTDN
jgi:hypothetical membrane protein